MGKISALLLAVLFAWGARAAWYWPFGSDEPEPPRLSELLEPASTNIDAAADFMADGKTSEALAKYNAALYELSRLEAEHPDRADTPEFASLRTKRAYVTAAIAAIETEQARGNARAVVTTDTSELEQALKSERKIARLRKQADARLQQSLKSRPDGTFVFASPAARAEAKNLFRQLADEIEAIRSAHEAAAAKPYFAFLNAQRAHAEDRLALLAEPDAANLDAARMESVTNTVEAAESQARSDRPVVSDELGEYRSQAKTEVRKVRARGTAARSAQESAARIQAELEDDPDGRKAQLLRAGKAIREKDFAGARRELGLILAAKKDDVAALNLLGACAAAEGKVAEASDLFAQAIEANPDSHHAYYNLARLRLGALKDKPGARAAYDDGRKAGGPKDAKLEKALK